MGFQRERSARKARAYAYRTANRMTERRKELRRDLAGLVKKRAVATDPLALSVLDEQITATTARLDALESLMERGRGLGITTGTPGPHGHLSACEYNLVALLIDTAYESNGTEAIITEHLSTDELVGRVGFTEKPVIAAIKSLEEAGELTLHHVDGLRQRSWQVVDRVGPWWDEVMRDGFVDAWSAWCDGGRRKPRSAQAKAAKLAAEARLAPKPEVAPASPAAENVVPFKRDKPTPADPPARAAGEARWAGGPR